MTETPKPSRAEKQYAAHNRDFTCSCYSCIEYRAKDGDTRAAEVLHQHRLAVDPPYRRRTQ